MRTAALIGGPIANTFTVSGWTGSGSIAGGGVSDTLIAAKGANMTLKDASIATGDGISMTLSGIGAAKLTNTDSAHTLDASGFSGTTSLTAGTGGDVLLSGPGNDTLVGGSGSDILVGGGGNDSLTGGGGRDLLIGGAGASTLSGGGGDDLLIGGSTTYGSTIAALDAILAEWDRTDVRTPRGSPIFRRAADSMAPMSSIPAP